MHFSRIRVAAVGVAAAGLAATAVVAGATPSATAAGPGFSAHVILSAKAHGWTGPDDVTRLGNNIYVGFQNGVPSTGGSAGTPKTSTLVELTTRGHIVKTWPIIGKIDGLGTDAAHHRVLVTVNEDGNSSLYTVSATGASKHYAYNMRLPHGGGTDAISVFQGQIYTTASAPTGTAVPAVYRITLSGAKALVSTAKFLDNSPAYVSNGRLNTRIHLALTDPDSVSTVPADSRRFANQFMVDAQGDQQAIFVNWFTKVGTKLHVLNLSQSIDDTAFATHAGGMLIVTDSKNDTVDVVTGPFVAGAPYSSVTPGNANNAPANPVPNYLGKLNLTTGVLSPLVTSGVTVVPHGMIYVP